MTVGDRLKEERERTGLNQTDFAVLGNVTRRSQSNYESGERSPDAEYLAAISKAKVDVQYILTGQRSTEGGSPSASVEGMGEKEIGSPTVDAEILAGIIEGVEKSLAKRRLKLVPEKKAQVVSALYEYFKATGKTNLAAVERFLNLAS